MATARANRLRRQFMKVGGRPVRGRTDTGIRKVTRPKKKSSSGSGSSSSSSSKRSNIKSKVEPRSTTHTRTPSKATKKSSGSSKKSNIKSKVEPRSATHTRTPSKTTKKASKKTTKKAATKAYPVYKKASDKAKSFRQDFRDARKAGKKVFTWQGRKYNTKLKK